jgi:L,D-peptidoglycan transpeptidase YkuD (ErfK/YbiS/YcfS/YnhG family)
VDITLLDEQMLRCADAQFCCVIGKNGLIDPADKREGDGCTPRGTYQLRACYYRPDKFDAPPKSALPLIEIRPNMGWCDEPTHARYNQLVRLPFDASHEKLWRDDDCYDLIVPIGYNDNPIEAGRGSAIFMHIAKPDYSGTEGCVALSREDMLAAIAELTIASYIHINV